MNTIPTQTEPETHQQPPREFAQQLAVDWVTAEELAAQGVSCELIRKLPISAFGFDGRPCWASSEVADLLELVLREEP